MKKLVFAVLILMANKSFSKTWVVSNLTGFPADFSSLQVAVSLVPNGDTILVQGSPTGYGDIELSKKLVIMGPGYFLNENKETQVFLSSAQINSVIFKTGSSGSVLQGLDINGSLPREQNIGYGWCNGLAVNNFGSYSVEINTNNVTLISNIISILIVANSSNNIISRNWIGKCAVDGTSVGSVFSNNLMIGVVQDNNSTFNNNYISGTDEFHFFINTTASNNILGAGFNDTYCAGNRISINGGVWEHNIFSFSFLEGTTNFSTVNFADLFIGTGSNDGKFKLKAGCIAIGNGLGGIDIGPFGGATPYRLSGISYHPNIWSVKMPQSASPGTGLQIEIKVNANN